MSNFENEFEDYLDKKWLLEGDYCNYHSARGFYGILWDGQQKRLVTKYGDVEVMSRDTDYSDGQEERSLVFRLGDKFYRKIGYYDSWNTYDWHGDLTEVKPIEKTVILYQKV